MHSKKGAKSNRRTTTRSKSGRRPARQARGTSLASVARQMNRDPASMRPADVLRLQRAVGNRATGQRLAGSVQRNSKSSAGKSPGVVDGRPSQAARQNGGSAAVIQLAPEKTTVRGITHLVEMSGHTLLGGKEGKALYDGDVVVIDSADRYKSRRGIEAETDKSQYRDEDHDYKWFRALKVNDKDVSGEKFYVRREMLEELDQSSADPALDVARENEATRDVLEEARDTAERAADLGHTARNLFGRFGHFLGLVPENPSYDKAEYQAQTGRARDNLQAGIIVKAGQIGGRIDAELSNPTQDQDRAGQLLTQAKQKEQAGLGALAAIEKFTVIHGKVLFKLAASDGALPLWAEIIRLGDEAHDERVGGAAEANERIASLSSSLKEKASAVWGYFNNTFDAFGIIAASVAALTAVAAVGIIVGIAGYILGGIAAIASFYFAEKTNIKQEELAALKARLEEGQVGQDMVDIAEYARQQKRKKKIRQRTVGTAAVVVATIAIIGIAGGPVGLAMAILAASIGVGFIAYKALRKWFGKKKAMKDLVGGARKGDAEKIAALTKMGISGGEIAGLGNKATRSAVESKVEQALKDKRVDTANQLVNSLRSGKPSEKLAAEKILDALGVDAAKAADPAVWEQKKAVSKVASKLSSW